MTEYTIVKGDSTPTINISIDGYTTLDSNWKCTVYVKEHLDRSETEIIKKDAPVVSGNLTDIFQCYLTPDETEQLESGKQYYWIFEIENSTLSIPFRKELQNILYVSPSAV